MPKISHDKVVQSELPRTLRRSPAKAQRTFAKAHDSAVKTYGPGQRANRVAYAALKHTFEKVGDHWQQKSSPGPSDERAAKPTSEAVRGKGRTFGGVNVRGNTRQTLAERAKKLGVSSTGSMTKQELGRSIQKKQKKMTKAA